MKNLFLTILSGLSIPAGIAITKALIGSVGAGLSMYIIKKKTTIIAN